MKFNRDCRRSYRNSDNCLDTELTPAHNFDCPAILATLQERNRGPLFINKSLCGQYRTDCQNNHLGSWYYLIWSRYGYDIIIITRINL
ncbi:UNVERIFIED_CONTAM: hypothetical protein NCL1_39313 [Trichonephila clavipes]